MGSMITLTLPSELRMLSVARGFVEAVCEAHRLDRTITHALVIVTGEVISNIVRHAHQDRPGSKMELQMEIEDACVVLTFRDEGQPFDLSAVPDLPPGELRIGGRGIYLMRALMDELTCECRDGQSGNILRMVKRLATMRECG
jgi:serine/threonine-protein kinase RsbW